MVIYDAYDVIVVPFPFTDKNTTKRRPAVVLSQAGTFNLHVGQSVLAMVTSASNSEWPLDTEIIDLDSAGLSSASIIRMKLFTLDNQLIAGKAGILSNTDQKILKLTLSKLFPK